MKKSLRISEEAIKDHEYAAAWYEHKQTGLGEQLKEAFKKAHDLLLQTNPPLTPIADVDPKLGCKKVVLHRFPYLVIVKDLKDTRAVIAVAHQSRKQDYWISRTKFGE